MHGISLDVLKRSGLRLPYSADKLPFSWILCCFSRGCSGIITRYGDALISMASYHAKTDVEVRVQLLELPSSGCRVMLAPPSPPPASRESPGCRCSYRRLRTKLSPRFHKLYLLGGHCSKIPDHAMPTDSYMYIGNCVLSRAEV